MIAYPVAPIAVSTHACPFLAVKPRPTPTQIGERALKNLSKGRAAKSAAHARLREEIRAIWNQYPGVKAALVRSRLKRKNKPTLRTVQRIIKTLDSR